MPDEDQQMLTDGEDIDQDGFGHHSHKTVGSELTTGVSSGDMAQGAAATSDGITAGGGMEIAPTAAQGSGASSADPLEDDPPPP